MAHSWTGDRPVVYRPSGTGDLPGRIVVVGASLGGIDALRAIVASLPADFPARICVVLHMAPEALGILDAILARAGVLPAVVPRDHERLRHGQIYVAPPDHHLLVEPGVLRVTHGPRENRFRPAIDPLFRSAAQVFGPAAVGVILTGGLDDGTAGLWAIKQLGGITLVQDPDDAFCPSMPRSAIDHVDVDYVLPLARIADTITEVVSAPVGVTTPSSTSQAVEVEVRIAKEHNPLDAGLADLGRPSIFTCPECGGVLLELREGTRTRFRCHAGHGYSTGTLTTAIRQGVEEAMWGAVRVLEEAQLLMIELADHLKSAHPGASAEDLLERERSAAAGRHDQKDGHVEAARRAVRGRGDGVNVGSG